MVGGAAPIPSTPLSPGKPLSTDNEEAPGDDGGPPVVAIVGGALGGVAMVAFVVGAVILRLGAAASDGPNAGVEGGWGRGGSAAEWSSPPLPMSRGAVGGGVGDVATGGGEVATDADGRSGGIMHSGLVSVDPTLAAGGGTADAAGGVAAAAAAAAAATAAMLAADASDEEDSDSSSSSETSDSPSGVGDGGAAGWGFDDDGFPRVSDGGGMDLGPAPLSTASAASALSFDYIMGAGEAGTRSQGRRLRKAAAAGEGDPSAVLGAGGSLASLGGGSAA